ncbi:cytochrome P450 [Laetiporus sulphureus 93-53]|uniref:Cytochrome P450 n=1 Tax=Laetiporus sulphureus 93-53 TaxID=1314785 RepID=A0A165DWS7_9APHY|nr:cytochrome P450 [Laetiporus sulphureus 93-53]KZT05788.1 cytochrome P450 [Laetiporus sulphureus 93-53]
MLTLFVLALLAASVAALALRRVLTCSPLQRLPLPPGPKPLPFVGNLFQIPSEGRVKLFTQWRQTYGDVVYFHACGREFVVLNSASAATDLLDKRGTLYSDRPYSTMASILVGRWKSLLQLRYGERFRISRKHMRNALNARTISESLGFQEDESVRLLQALLVTPEQFPAHIRRNVGAVSLNLTYGYRLHEGDGYLLTLAEEFSRITGDALASGRWLVDIFPWLRYVPSWMPGAHFKRWAQWARRRCEELVDAPYDYVKTRIAEGNATSCFTSRALEALQEETRKTPTLEDEDIIKNVATSLYTAGTDTVSDPGSSLAMLSSFILMMVCHPDIQRKAQAEIDKVTGGTRLPTHADQDKLPYVECVIKELHRYNPVAPFVPHSVMQDDEYRGFRIPKGAWVGANTWGILHDPAIHPEPERFNPDRFMDDEKNIPQRDPREFSFGLGRRRCPGVMLAASTLFIVVSRILAVFDILKPVDEVGQEYMPPMEFTSDNIVYPKPFDCRILPRSTEAIAVIQHHS